MRIAIIAPPCLSTTPHDLVGFAAALSNLVTRAERPAWAAVGNDAPPSCSAVTAALSNGCRSLPDSADQRDPDRCCHIGSGRRTRRERQ
jgi:hypothetical protein